MSSKDYKNALNDIRLSSDFCAKMEEKLSKAEFDDDDYQEVENHVEVIENKGFKKYLAAAAVIAVIGTVGGGGYMRLKDNFGSDEQYGVDSEIEEVTSETKNSDSVFDFPFASIDLKGTTFILQETNYGSIHSEVPVVASYDMAAQLIEVFSQVNWNESKSVTYTVNIPDDKDDDDNSEADEIYTAINASLNGENITFNYGYNGDYYYVHMYESGMINVSMSSVDNGLEKEFGYNMTSEQYQAIKTVIFGKEEHMATFAGIKADLSGARYAINGQSGTVTDEQAKYLAKCLKEMSDTMLSEDHKERPANEEPISLFIKDDAYDCRVDFYSTGEAFNKKMINSTNEITERAYNFNPIVYSDIKNILAGLDDIPCPVDIADMDGTLLKCTFDNKCNVYALDKEQLKQLQSLLENCNWKPELYTTAIMNSSAFAETSFYNNSIVLKNKEQFLFIYSGGLAIYSDKNGTASSMPDIYHIDGIDQLISETKAMNSKMTPLSTNELINRELDICLSGDIAEVNLLGTDYPYTESGRKIPTAKLREVFEGLEWEEMEFKEYADESELYDEIYSQYDEDGVNIKLYMINQNSVYKMFGINNPGIYTNQETGRSYRCTEPEKVVERLDKLYEEYKK